MRSLRLTSRARVVAGTAAVSVLVATGAVLEAVRQAAEGVRDRYS